MTTAFGLAVSMTAMADDSAFVSGTSVNGLGIGGMTVEQAGEHISSFYSSKYQLKIKERGGKEETINGADIGFAVGLPDGFLQTILDQQNASGRAFGPDVDNSNRTEMANTFDEQALTDKVNALNCLSGSGIVTTADAYISSYQEGQPFEIVPEVNGNNLYPDKVLEAVKNAVTSGNSEVDLEASGCYYAVTVTKDDEGLKNLCDTLNQVREMSITYVIGDQSEVLDSATICSWITGTADGQIQMNRDQVAGWVQTLAGKYNTAGTTRTFHTATGRDVSVSGPYGWKIDQNAETDALIGMIRTGQTQSREPQYVQTAVDHSAQEWGTTYVEVDLTGQHVYMTKNGSVVWDAPCVTGNVSKNYTTPAGLYSLTYKERDRVLRGAKKADGTYEYESPVSYWMPFNGGIGFHDATWRSKFGGTIYQNSGSHGCVNLPPEKAKLLYDLVYKGIPVICYQ